MFLISESLVLMNAVTAWDYARCFAVFIFRHGSVLHPGVHTADTHQVALLAACPIYTGV